MDDADLQVLLDKQAIYEVLLRYARGIDRGDVELVRSAYHADSVDDHGNFAGTGWELAEWAIDTLARTPQITTHLISNPLITVDGDTAHSECYAHGAHVLDDGARVVEFHCRYIDRFERRAGIWAISDRRVVHDWNEVRPIVPAQRPTDSRFTRGRRSRADPVYTLPGTTTGTREHR